MIESDGKPAEPTTPKSSIAIYFLRGLEVVVGAALPWLYARPFRGPGHLYMPAVPPPWYVPVLIGISWCSLPIVYVFLAAVYWRFAAVRWLFMSSVISGIVMGAIVWGSGIGDH